MLDASALSVRSNRNDLNISAYLLAESHCMGLSSKRIMMER